MKKILSLLLIIIMVISIFSSVPVSAMKIELVEVSAPSQTEIVTWLNAQVGKSLDYDGAYGAQCVDLVKYYYDLFGYSNYARGNGGDYATNSLPPGWTRIQGAVPEVGDVLVWTGGPGGYGHVAVYGGDNKYFHQNWSGKYVEIIYKSYTSGITYKAGGFAPYWGVIRPQFGNTTHTHNYDTYSHYVDAHPHYKCYKCSCGDIKQNTNESAWSDNCRECLPNKSSLKVIVGSSEDYTVFKWTATSNTDSYTVHLTNVDEGVEYPLMTGITDLSYQMKLSAGNYLIAIASINDNLKESNLWYNMSNRVEFTVTEKFFEPIKTVTYNENVYEIYDMYMPWGEAKAKCEELGGHLVTIGSQSEMDAIKVMMPYGSRYGYWIGYSDLNKDGEWESVTNESMEYTYWAENQPDYYENNEDCAIIQNEKEYRWNDVPNDCVSYPIGFICEYEGDVIEGVTRPSTDNEDESTDSTEATTEPTEGTNPTEVTTETLVDTDPTEATTESPTVTEPTVPSIGDDTKPSVPIELSTNDDNRPSEPVVYKAILGDVNSDCKVNIKDATQIQKFAAKLMKFTDTEFICADVNTDAKVNIKDATAIQKFIAMIETGLPIGKPVV